MNFNIIEFSQQDKALAESFHCGNLFIDKFIKSNLAFDNGFGRTYVWLNQNKTQIIGFYNITTGSVNQYIDGVQVKIGGSVHINEFALDVSRQKKLIQNQPKTYMSDYLLNDCLNRIIKLRKIVGFSFVTLYSTQEGYNLYLRNDFSNIEDDMILNVTYGKEDGCIPMYLPLDIEQ